MTDYAQVQLTDDEVEKKSRVAMFEVGYFDDIVDFEEIKKVLMDGMDQIMSGLIELGVCSHISGTMRTTYDEWIAERTQDVKTQAEPEVTPCGCFRCNPTSHVPGHGMIVCDKCGNKRCPHATDHQFPCSGSNEPGQKGSIYGPLR